MSLDTEPASRTFQAAQGYYELGMFADAWAELNLLEPAEQTGSATVALRLAILVGWRRFTEAAALAESLEAQGCQLPDLYISGAYAIRRCRSLPEAKTFLLAGRELNPECATIHYNLACYDSQLGHLEAARCWLRQAFRLHPGYRQIALKDPDLEPLRQSPGGLGQA